MSGRLLRPVVSFLFTLPLHSQKPLAAIDFGRPDFSKLHGAKRTTAIRRLALAIRALQPSAEKVVLASELANESDRDTLQELTTTYAEALRETPGQSPLAYLEVARLVRYEHVKTSLDDAGMRSAMAILETEDREIQSRDFTLTDLRGKIWTLKQLRGKVVLVNFWGVGCLPCMAELPALQSIHEKF